MSTVFRLVLKNEFNQNSILLIRFDFDIEVFYRRNRDKNRSCPSSYKKDVMIESDWLNASLLCKQRLGHKMRLSSSSA